MPKKIAVFVEGQTERIFTMRLIVELVGEKKVVIQHANQNKGVISFTPVDLEITEEAHAFLLLIDCKSQEQVKTQILDQYEKLKGAGYSVIIGLRDIYPKSHNEIELVKSGTIRGLPNTNPPIEFHFSILEVEAWFIEEKSHFYRIDSRITPDLIIDNGFDYNNITAADLTHPAETLKAIYRAAGTWYSKSKDKIERTVSALCFEEIYTNTRLRAPSLDRFIHSLERAIF